MADGGVGDQSNDGELDLGLGLGLHRSRSGVLVVRRANQPGWACWFGRSCWGRSLDTLAPIGERSQSRLLCIFLFPLPLSYVGSIGLSCLVLVEAGVLPLDGRMMNVMD